MATKTTVSEVLKVLDRQGVPDIGLTVDKDNYVTIAFVLSDQDTSLDRLTEISKVLSKRTTVYVKNYFDPLNYLTTIRGEKQ